MKYYSAFIVSVLKKSCFFSNHFFFYSNIEFGGQTLSIMILFYILVFL